MGRTVPEQPGFSLPVGTVTFLLTDIEGSTRAWEASRDAMGRAVARHYEILDEAITTHHGVRPIEQGEGDSVVGAFARASDAVAAALDAQRAFATEAWPPEANVKVRMAVHTGEAELRDEGNYFGPAVIRCARLRAIAHGGQILVSSPTADLVADRLPEGAALTDRGLQRLKDLGRPERVFELHHEDLPLDFGPLQSLDVFPNNLPVQLTTFVGRRSELAELQELLGTTRLLTLNGAGGCGKTRLALQVAADAIERYPGGAWVAELAPVGDPDRIPAAVAATLGEIELAGDATEILVARLTGAPALVVLDNCEHVLGAAAAFVDAILRRCADVTFIATSREPLGVPGETAWRVPSLSLPSSREPLPVDALPQFDAVRLFLDRVVKARPNFRLTEDNAPAIAQICHRLDGIPLAIELAAARVRGLSVERVAAGLDDRFRLLTGGARTVLPRQQTLQASVDWGYELLSPAEQTVFRRLSIFAGGFTLDAAEAVVPDGVIESDAVLALLLSLVDKSMVSGEDDLGRYGILETLRQYGTARLLEAGETSATRTRHKQWALTVWDPVEARLEDRFDDVSQLAELELENLRAAFEWAMTESDVEAALALGGGLVLWERIQGDVATAADLGRRALSLEGGDARLRLLVHGDLLRATWELADRPAVDALMDDLADHIESLPEEDDDVRAWLLIGIAFGGVGGSRIRDFSSLLEQGVECARRANRQRLASLAVSLLVVRNAMRGEFALVDEMASAIASQGGVGGGNARIAMIHAAIGRGEFASARHLLDLYADRRLAGTSPRVAAQLELNRLTLDVCEGVDTGAYQRFAAVRATAIRKRFRMGERQFGWAPGGWELAHGDPAEALRLLEAWTSQTVMGAEQSQFSRSSIAIVVQAFLINGRNDSARRWLDDVDAGIRWHEPWGVARAAYARALLHRATGAGIDADQLFTALAIQQEHGLRPDLVHTLEALAGTVSMSGASADAARLAGAAQSLRDEMGYVLRWPFEQQLYDGDIAAARAALGDESFEAAFNEGRALSLDEAVAYATRARGQRGRPKTGWESLTPTETSVVELAADGHTNKEIAERLLMGAETVKTHLSRVYDKIGVRNRAELATAWSARGGGSAPPG